MSITLSVIIVNWNTGKLLAECIDSIYEKTKGVGFEIIVVDNASTDNSLDLIKPRPENLHIIKEIINHGFGKANNIGLKKAIGEYICFLNPDTALINDAFTIMVGKIKEYGGNVAAAGPLVVKTNGENDMACSRSFPTILKVLYQKTGLEKLVFMPKTSLLLKYGDYQNTYIVPVISGSCMLFDGDAIKIIGGFDEGYFMYGEDIDICFRLKQSAHNILFVPDAKILHYGGASSKNVSNEMAFETIKSMSRYFSNNHSKTAGMFYRAILVPIYLLKILPHIIFIYENSHRSKILLFGKIVLWLLGQRNYYYLKGKNAV